MAIGALSSSDGERNLFGKSFCFIFPLILHETNGILLAIKHDALLHGDIGNAIL